MSLSSQFQTFEKNIEVAGGVANDVAFAQIYPSSALNFKTVGGLIHLKVTLLTAVITQVGLIQPITKGTQTNGTVGTLVSSRGVSYPSGGPGPFLLAATGWSAAPTYNTATFDYIRKGYLPAVIGSAFEWVWPEDNPLMLALLRAEAGGTDNNGLVLRNITGGAAGQIRIQARWKTFSPSLL